MSNLTTVTFYICQFQPQLTGGSIYPTRFRLRIDKLSSFKLFSENFWNFVADKLDGFITTNIAGIGRLWNALIVLSAFDKYLDLIKKIIRRGRQSLRFYDDIHIFTTFLRSCRSKMIIVYFISLYVKLWVYFLISLFQNSWFHLLTTFLQFQFPFKANVISDLKRYGTRNEDQHYLVMFFYSSCR